MKAQIELCVQFVVAVWTQETLKCSQRIMNVLTVVIYSKIWELFEHVHRVNPRM
jgi:hypothetical protein